MISLDDILKLETLDELSSDDALMAVARIVDHGGDTQDEAMVLRAFAEADALEARGLRPAAAAALDYFRANAWQHLQTVRRVDPKAQWRWEQEEIEKQIFHLRRAVGSEVFDDLEPGRQCQILTNLANQLDTLGRFVESRAYWTRALAIGPIFWMARGNRGRGLMHYAHALYDPGHRDVFALRAHQDLLGAVIGVDQYPAFDDPKWGATFLAAARQIGQAFPLDDIEADYHPDLGSLDDIGYRQWCLNEVLFLNPLNDLEPRPIAARDLLSLPTFKTGFQEAPVLIGFFNQLKQEYVSARWLLWEGLQPGDTHNSDRDVLLYNTLDYPAYGLAIEKVRLAFRTAYSLFDKIAYFLNHYLDLKIPEKRVNFQSVWRDKTSQPIRDAFATRENWPWRGLYWLSKDLFEPNVRAVLNPDGRHIHDLRNHLEHKYLKVHDIGPVARPADAPFDLYNDTLAFSINLQDLERRTVELMRLVRAALIYLSLGMHREEQRRSEGSLDKLSVPMAMEPLEEDRKR